MQWGDQKCNVFKIAKRVVKVISILLVSKIVIDEENKRAWKSCHEKLLNTEFARDSKSLFQADTITSIPCSVDKDMVRELINKKWKGCWTVKCSVRNGKDSRRSRS